MKSSKIIQIATIGIALVLLVISGCTKRDNPLVPAIPTPGLIAGATHQYDGLSPANAIWSQTASPAVSRRIFVYTPPGYKYETVGPRYPVLYLLPGYDGEPSFDFEFGNENYFVLAGISKVADRLIASGEIKPFLIVMPDASFQYGGSFYANSVLAGKWEDMMAMELVEYMDNSKQLPDHTSFLTLPDKESRAISGHSSGGYGALRIAMKYDTVFNSVSAIDAPLAFAGSGSFTGIKGHFRKYLDESNITSPETYFGTDTTQFRKQPYKLLIYSMAATFSPAPKDLSTSFGKLQIALPFDYQGNDVQSVWDLWLANDLYGWLDNPIYQTNLKNLQIYLETSDHDVNGFNQQTELFEEKLTAKGIPFTAAKFSKYPGYDAQSRSFLYDRLEYILKFHNKWLKDRDGNF